MTNPIIQTDLAEILKEIKSDQKAMFDEMRSGQKEILAKVNNLEVSLETVKGDIKAVDERLSGQITAVNTKVEQIDKRISNQEFFNRGIFGGIVLIVLGGAAKIFGWVGNP
jgi:chromosome segregation ATPase